MNENQALFGSVAVCAQTMTLILTLTLGLSLVGVGCSDDATGSDPDAGDAALPDTGPADATPPDARPDAESDGGGVVVGPLIELPLLDSWDPSRPFNHSAEVTVAAQGDHVVAAYINMHFAAADVFDTTGFHKRVGVAVSHDRGETYQNAIDPGLGDQTTDPVVRVAADGTFWLALWDTNAMDGSLASSADHGESWLAVVPSIGYGDKEWIAIDDPNQLVYVGAVSGMWQFSFAGVELAHVTDGGGMLGAYVDATGAHFATGGPDFTVLQWDGTGSPVSEGAVVPGGAEANELNMTLSLGRTTDGGQWIVRGRRSVGVGTVAVRVRYLPGDEGTDLDISDPAAVAFFPAAATDAAGRLHVIWYESGTASGVLKYTRSLTDDPIQGFQDALVIDPDACPAGGWYPFFSSADGGRRLREYIDLSVDGNRAQLVWTHSPIAPSRVHTTYVEFP